MHRRVSTAHHPLPTIRIIAIGGQCPPYGCRPIRQAGGSTIQPKISNLKFEISNEQTATRIVRWAQPTILCHPYESSSSVGNAHPTATTCGSTQHSALSPQSSVLSTQSSVLSLGSASRNIGRLFGGRCSSGGRHCLIRPTGLVGADGFVDLSHERIGLAL